MAGTATGNAIQSAASASAAGTVTSVTATDTSIVVTGTATAPTVATGTLDVIAADHPPAANWSNNSHKITSLANGTAAQDAAAFGQIPAALPPNGSAGGDLGSTYPNPTVTATHLASALPVAQGGTGLTAPGSDGQVLAVNSSGTVAWMNAPVDWYNVKTQYGATGNGSTNDTTAIQAALTACAAAGGGTVFLPTGTYITSNLTIDSLVTLRGNGDASVLSAVSGTTGYMLALTTPATTANVTVRAVKFLGNNLASLGGVQLDNTGFGTSTEPSHVMDQVEVWNAAADAFHFDNTRSLRISKLVAFNAGNYGCYVGGHCSDSRITDCVFGPTAANGMEILGFNNTVTGCKIYYSGFNGSTFNTSSVGIHLNGTQSTHVGNCEAQNAALYGIDVDGCDQCAVVGCDADGNGMGAASTGVGININGSTNCAIVGNVGSNVTGTTQWAGVQVAGTNTGTYLAFNALTGTAGPFSYVSGGGYMLVSSLSADFSGVTTTFKLPAGTLIVAGTASAAPLNLTSGTSLTTAAAGAVEYDGTAFYATAAASSRQVIDAEQFQILSSNRTFTNNTSAQAIFNATTNGTLTVQATTTYFFECWLNASGFSASSHTINFGLGGTATFTSINYIATMATTAGGNASVIDEQSASASAITNAGTGTVLNGTIRGTMRINAGGTIIPQLTQVTASAAAVVTANSYFRIWPAGTNTVTNVGDWS